MKKKAREALALMVAIAVASSSAWGDEREDLEVVRQTTINLINALVDKGVLTRDAATAMIHQAEEDARKKVAATTGPKDNVVRVPYVPETVKREIREQVKQEVVAQAKAEHWGDVNAVPEWTNRIKVEGDLRLRFESDLYSSKNAPPAYIDNYYGLTPGTTGNTSDRRDRWRVRGRIGLTANISPLASAGLRIATGSDNNPLSTNQTLGNTSTKYELWVDEAFLKLDPLDWLSAIGGRIPNPWFSTNLVWHSDLTFEGAAVHALYRFNERRSNVFLTAGAFPLQDVAPAPENKAKSKWLFGVQGGVDLTSLSGSKAKFGVALYDYQHVEGIPDTGPGLLDYDATKPQFHQRGNTMFLDPYSLTPKLASKFRELNLTGQLDLATFDPNHLILTADYVRNIGFDQQEIAQRTGYLVPRENTGYQLQATFGRPQVADEDDWQVFIGYRYLQADAVLDAFTDSDFHLGGTDAKGYFLGGSYGLDKHTWLTLRWLSADSISGPPLGIDVFQFDLNAKF
jgi:hypothetical protein